MKLLVTGGAGFIGSNYIRYAREKHPDYKIICVDLLTYAGNMENIAEFTSDKEHFAFYRCDIANKDEIENVFSIEKPDIVINFAAESHVDRSLENPSLFLRTNILGTQVLMDACLKHDVKRFHQISTDEVYGDLPLDRPDLKFTEENKIKTSSPYSASKASADLLVSAYHRTFKLPATISRCSNNYGPYHFPEKLIPLVISRAVSEEKIPVYGKGENVRDWIYVEDHCSAIDKIIHIGEVGNVYNVGGNSEKRNIDVVKEIIKQLGKSEDLITFVKDRPGHDLRYAIDSTKIQKELGWKPLTSFEVGIEKTIKWYLANEPWWKNIISGEYKQYYQKMYANREL